MNFKIAVVILLLMHVGCASHSRRSQYVGTDVKESSKGAFATTKVAASESVSLAGYSAGLDDEQSIINGQSTIVEAVAIDLQTLPQSEIVKGDHYGVEDAIALALIHNPTVPQARALVRQQQGATLQAGLYPNPQLGYLRSDPDQPGKSRSNGAFVGQEFVTAGKLELAKVASQYDVTLRCWQVTAQELRVANDVRIRYFDLAAAYENQSIAKELEKLAEDQLNITRSLLEGNLGSKPDILQAEIQLSFAKGAVYDAGLRIESAKRGLESVIGTSLPDKALSHVPRSDFPDLSWDVCLDTLYSESPLLKSQSAEVEAARIEIQLAQAQAIPNLNAQMVAQRDSFEKYSSVGTFVSIAAPVFNKNQGNIESAQAFYVQQFRELDRIKLALADQLSGSFRSYHSLINEHRRLQKEVLPRSEENMNLYSDGYKIQRIDFARVVEAQRLWFQTRSAILEAYFEAEKALVEIEGLQLTGALNPTEVGTALQSSSNLGTNGARNVLRNQLESNSNRSQRNLPAALQGADF